ncbi:phosphatases II [Athelia psychrophila]|uniref:Phosphatases II n=1 Tax=Athelia psychrophila TaxID=1759441 RepID=A0A166S130_9AGAM|nr:phosphatases II [Fibularhizoctonia sp. CBS 109695]
MTAMISHPKPILPRWLQLSQSPLAEDQQRIKEVLVILRDREGQRSAARAASCYPSVPKAHEALISHYSIVQSHGNPGNRYSDIVPYDRTKVALEDGVAQGRAGARQPRYLNASWVRELYGGRWFIATQAPRLKSPTPTSRFGSRPRPPAPDTVHEFLSFILQSTTCPPTSLDPTFSGHSPIRTVVQLTRYGGRQADAYFPDVVAAGEKPQKKIIPAEEGSALPPLEVKLLKVLEIPEAHCVQSTVSITSAAHSEPVVFTHMMYAAWPDHGVPEPEDHPSLLQFIRLVEQNNHDGLPPGTDGPPIIVNCSAGIGRTGTFLALSSLLRAHGLLTPPYSAYEPALVRAPATPLPLPPSLLGPMDLPAGMEGDLVASEIDSLREQRPGMVQTDVQVLLIYQVFAMAATASS